MNAKRLLRHLLTPRWLVRRRFPADAMHAIEAAIRDAETKHGGQICFAVEAALDFAPLVRGETARERALEVFANLRVWDTAQNNGVLIYLLLADHDVEILADRGAHARIGAAAWEAICHSMEAAFRAGDFAQGALAGIRAVSEELARHYPPGVGANEVPDRPVVL